MGFVEGRTRFGKGTRPTIHFAILAAVLTLPVVLLLAFPARALAAPELSIGKQGPTRVEPGTQFDYLLTVSNADGADPATGVTVTDVLPDGVTLAESEPDICGPIDGSSVTCDPFNLEAGESEEITLTVEVASNKVGEITNRVKVEANGVSPVNSNEVTTTVAPNLVIEKLGDPDPVRPEGVLLYTLRVENQGEGNADEVAVRDELPLDEVDFIYVVSEDFDCEYTAGVVRCTGGSLGPDEFATVEIAVEPEKAGTIQNTGAVFVQGVSEPLDTDTESTVVQAGGNPGPDPDPDPDPGPDPGPGTPGGDDLPEGEQCSPVVERGTENPIGVLSGTTPQGFIFTNTFNEVLPLRIVYATSSENGSLTITAEPRGGGEPILDETIQGKKRDVIEVGTEPGVDYEILIQPEDQGYAIQFEMGVGTEECTDPSDLDPPAGPGSDDGANDDGANDDGANDDGANDDGGTGADDVIDKTISDNQLPPTGGPSLPGLAVIALGLAVLGGATVVSTGVRRRGR